MELFLNDKVIILDGGLGTMLQEVGLSGAPELAALEAPDVLYNIHRAYVEAGASAICANTFGLNAKKLAGTGYTVREAVTASLRAAKRACDGTGAKAVLDIGPLGELLEPGGTLTFEEAYALFAEIADAGREADLVLIDTMTDLYEAKAALLAVREHTDLPVIASMSFEANGRAFTGATVETMALTLGGLGVAALGLNCSLGPRELLPLARRLCAASALPVMIKPNAGLPDPASGAFPLGPKAFCEQMEPFPELGVSLIGGCCGTTPETVARLSKAYAGRPVPPRTIQPASRLCSATRMLEITGVHPIGERINPTGKPKLKEALRRGDIQAIQSLAAAQEADDAELLDVNTGVPEVDEVAMLPRAVKAVQAVCGLPLQLDSANPAALEAALRVYNGRALVNSTSGEADKLAAVLPLCRKYGAAVVGLTLDESGIPPTAEGRLAVAEKILNAALAHGLAKEDVFIDCLTLATAAQPEAARETLQAVCLVKERLGLKTVLGVSNVSFGLPDRPLINRTFLTMALHAGLCLPILNPADQGMRDAMAAFRLLDGLDQDGFLARYGGAADATLRTPATDMPLDTAIERGLKPEATAAARALLSAGIEGLDVVNGWLTPALDKVGEGFAQGKIFLPQLLAAAGAAGAAFDEVKAAYGPSAGGGPTVVLATVKGDIHDIGKNIVRVLLESHGFTVLDLGQDVPPERVTEAAVSSGTGLVGLSALMTTSLPAMRDTIAALRRAGASCQVMVGGAVLTEAFALSIGADFYGRDAKRAVDIARKVYGS